MKAKNLLMFAVLLVFLSSALAAEQASSPPSIDANANSSSTDTNAIIVALPVEGASETVKCVFAGTEKTGDAEECHSEFGSCTGSESCIVKVNGPAGKKVEWKSNCGGYAYTIIDGTDEYANFSCSTTPTSSSTESSPVPAEKPKILAETVKCLFNNSANTTEECYSDYGKCSGNQTCGVEVKGETYTTVTWKSTCGGYAYTKIDGENEYAKFDCGSTTTTPTTPPIYPSTPSGKLVSESVKCIFTGSPNKGEECYSSYGSCKAQIGEGATCAVNLKGEKGDKVLWKSSCGGYATTFLDGDDEYAKFDCTPPKPPTPTPSGKVVIYEYADFECPYCGSFHRNTKPMIEKVYGDKVEFVFKHFPLSFHTNAQKAAEASECARNQGRFWEYAETLFANQGDLGRDALKRYADKLGLNVEKFVTCLDSGETATTVKDDYSEGIAKGISGTPTFIMVDQRIVGAQPFEAFRQAIDAQLGDDTGDTVKEEVKCIFKGAEGENKCYASDYEQYPETFCKGIGVCVTGISGKKGTGVYFYSSCSPDDKYSHMITLDGESETLGFVCGPRTLPPGEKEPIPTPTKEEKVPPRYCNEGDTRNYDCSNSTKVTWCSCIGGQWRCVEAPEKACRQSEQPPLPPACTGCEVKGTANNCLATGTRLVGDAEVLANPAVARSPIEVPLYCDLDKKLKSQKTDGSVCQNNFECGSNTCSSGLCVNLQKQLTEQRNVLQQIVDWLTSIFGFRPK